MDPSIFREYDIRGLVDDTLTADVVELLGKGYGTYIQNNGGKKVTVGRDARESGVEYGKAFIKGINSTGVDVLDLGVVPTPVVYFSMFYLPVDGGVMITGSHNPPEYNGFKVGINKTTISGKEIQNFRKLIESGEFPAGTGTVEQYDIISPYKIDVKKRFVCDKKLRIAIDAGNGVGGITGPDLLRGLGHEVHELFCEVDGTFPNHHPDPTVDKNLDDLINIVKEKQLDFGMGYDGDADRIGLIDDLGRIVRGDQILAIFAQDLFSRKKGEKVIFDVKCSQALPEFIEENGGVPVIYKTGHSLIKSKMKEEKSLLAGEMSGHIFFGEKYYGYDDAVFASCLMAELVSKTDKKLSEIVDTIPKYFSTPEIRAETTEEDKWKIVEKASEYFKANYDTIDIDGVRILFGDGWGLIRASNTQAVIVMRFEAQSQDRLNEIQELVTGKIKEFGEVKI